ncbi:PP2C family protein-serine/threonine phosphatase [Clostridium estertheticum]|uniref:Protein phosphatase n=1 Tax=Clostridium estertheticum TaxID=238834 RepID=A0A5N7IMS8_9CLOT|nr:protein phosphatase [Clostridium estertheticum]MCB2340713.1 protein phosphatase [Clostridium estertheticum]MCB2359244.1 protein phosphatase [Clostridium estertheticum]MPQ31617.1 protein phosphatase [Clostridium estertheticum]MPQ62290.1 protein phosphatase [Clostridium estertheticum]
MIEFAEKNYCMVILILLIIILVLVGLKNILIKIIDKSYIKIESAATIGNEEIYEDHMETICSPQGTLAVLADGLGKNEAGRISSITTINTFRRLFLQQWNGEKTEYFFNRAFNEANSEILRRVDNNQGGASVVSAIIVNNLLHYGLVGNAMVAVYRKGELFKLSEGHTVNVLAKNEFYKGKLTKEKALLGLKEKGLLNYLGQDDFKDIEMLEKPVVLKKKDIIILMNKGVYNSLTWIQIEEILKNNKKLKNMANGIIQVVKSKEKINKENGSIILMKYIYN